MATQQQQQQFVTTYAPYANQAGAQLGVSGNVILGHWAGESDWGTSNVAQTTGNLAGINLPGSTTGTNYASYSSPQDFTNAYVSTLQNPRYSAALNTGSDGTAFANGLAAGGYFPQSSLANETSFINSGAATASNWNTGSTTLASNSDPSGGFGSNGSTDTTYVTSNGNTVYQVLGSDGQPTGALVSGNATDPATNYLAPGESLGPAVNTGTDSGIVGAPAGSRAGTPSDTGTSTSTSPTTTTTTSPTTTTTGTGTTTTTGIGGVGAGTNVNVGLQTSTKSTIAGWINSIESAVGTWMTTFAKNAFGSVANWFERMGLIVLAIILIALALWRLMDPDGEKTKRLASSMTVAV